MYVSGAVVGVLAASGFLAVSWVLLVVFALLSVVFLVLLVLARSAREVWSRRDDVRREEVRRTIFDLVMGDEPESAAARAVLEATSGRRRRGVQDRILTVLPKLRGDSRDLLVDLLLAQGAEQRALSLTRSRWSAVRRCRGAFQLGVLGLTQHLDVLVRLLDDNAFLVRRVAVRALGNCGDPRAVRPLLLLGERDTRLTRDLVYALDRLGPAGAPELRAVLAEEMDAGEHVHLGPAAVVLGLLADRASIEVLGTGLESPDPAFAQACAEAMGRIGAPEAIPHLVGALLDLRPNVRASAAHALGSIGSSVAADSLADVVDEEDPQVSRQAAEALVELGAGRALLEASGSAYAREALALAAIREGRR